ncbi:MAG: dicarboxylate/amino acid:cation symporter [Treponema sp.]|nr:dicarboxylate/amino acid:cation symporter [Treponema sp.]
MKLWMKYLLGIAGGIILSFFVPAGSLIEKEIFGLAGDLVIRFGRYIILPLILFSVTTAVIKLRENKQMLKTTLWTLAVTVGSSVVLVVIGLISALIVKLPHIPITIKKATELPFLNLSELLTKLFPYSGFEVLTEGEHLLPAFLFAFLAGTGCAKAKNETKPAVSLFASLTHVCYVILSAFTQILSVGLAVITCRWFINIASLWKTGIYNSIIIRLVIDLVLVAFAVYPLLTRFLCHGTKVMRIAYAGIAPFLAAFFTGDSNIAITTNLRHAKESLCIEDQTAYFSVPLLSIFARGGAALVQTLSFVLILISYSELSISITNMLWIGSVSLLLSFVLGQLPSGGPFFAITIMCGMFGRGFEAGYLLLKDFAPVITSFAAGFDALTAIFGMYIIAAKTKTLHHQELSKFL